VISQLKILFLADRKILFLATIGDGSYAERLPFLLQHKVRETSYGMVKRLRDVLGPKKMNESHHAREGRTEQAAMFREKLALKRFTVCRSFAPF
jgi:hypothetical protein